MESTHNVIISQAPAVASWCFEESDEPSFFGHKIPDPSTQVTLNVRSSLEDNTASFGLRIPAGLKSSARRVPLFLNIPPENIVSLQTTVDLGESEVPERVRSSFIRDNVCSDPKDIMRLEFSLAGPSSAIVPKSIPLVPKTKASSNTLQSLRSLARALSLTLYIPSHGVSQNVLGSLCRQARDGAMKAMPDDVRLPALYGGKGGKEMDPGTPPPESPPSYDDIAELPQPPRTKSKSSPHTADDEERPAKRIRELSPKAPETKNWKSNVEQQMEALTQTVDAVRKQMDAMSERSDVNNQLEALRGQLQHVEQTMDSLRTQMVDTEQRVQRQLDDFKTEMMELLEERMEEKLEEAGDDFENQFDQMANGMENMVEERMDDRVLSFKEDLAEHVEDEMRTARRTLRNNLTRASLFIEIDEESE